MKMNATETKIAAVRQQAAAKLARLSLAKLVEAFVLTNGDDRPEIPDVREMLMDELERRDPEAFERWMLCDDPDTHQNVGRFFGL